MLQAINSTLFLKGIRRLIESLPLLKEKIHYKPVLTALQTIIEQTKKKADANAACTELEEKIQELLESETEIMKETDLMPPPSIMPKNRRNVRRSKYKNKNDEADDDSSEDDSEERDVDDTSIVKCE